MFICVRFQCSDYDQKFNNFLTKFKQYSFIIKGILTVAKTDEKYQEEKEQKLTDIKNMLSTGENSDMKSQEVDKICGILEGSSNKKEIMQKMQVIESYHKSNFSDILNLINSIFCLQTVTNINELYPMVCEIAWKFLVKNKDKKPLKNKSILQLLNILIKTKEKKINQIKTNEIVNHLYDNLPENRKEKTDKLIEKIINNIKKEIKDIKIKIDNTESYQKDNIPDIFIGGSKNQEKFQDLIKQINQGLKRQSMEEISTNNINDLYNQLYDRYNENNKNDNKYYLRIMMEKIANITKNYEKDKTIVPILGLGTLVTAATIDSKDTIN